MLTTINPILAGHYCNSAFTAQSGTFYPQSVLSNPASLGTFFQSYVCTVASGALTIPAVTLDSTQDSLDNPDASYSAVLWDNTSGKQIQGLGTWGSFTVPPTPTSTTWAAIFAAKADN
jgi:hypothetical protein